MKIQAIRIQNNDYQEQCEKADENYKDGFLSCPICGKNTNWEKSYSAGHILRIIDGGEIITDELDDTEGCDGDCGCFPVGATCWRKWIKAVNEAKSEA